MVKPITPKDVVSAKAATKAATLPDEVLEAFNEVIAENWDGHNSNFTQNTVVSRIVSKGKKRAHVFDKNWLEVEVHGCLDIYRKAGWEIDYDKPGYNEDYEANFTFTKM